MELRKKYRPESFKTFMGNEETVNSLLELIENEELPNSILLTGPRGCGKTTLGRIIRKAMECSDHDYKELDTGVFRGIDTVRDIRAQLQFSPRQGKVKFFLIDEAHMLGRGGASEKNEAQSALLKSLEEPPDYTYFILCTTNPEMLLSTIVDRCIEFKVGPLDTKETIKFLKKIAKKEKKELPKKVIQKIAKVANGMPRGSLSLLQKVINLKNEKKMLKMITVDNLEENKQIIDLCRALMSGKPWSSVAPIIKGLQHKAPEDVRRGIIGYSNAVLLNGNEGGSLILGWFVYKSTYDTGWPIITQFCYNVCARIEPPC